jgi:hypothetical protein
MQLLLIQKWMMTSPLGGNLMGAALCFRAFAAPLLFLGDY